MLKNITWNPVWARNEKLKTTVYFFNSSLIIIDWPKVPIIDKISDFDSVCTQCVSQYLDIIVYKTKSGGWGVGLGERLNLLFDVWNGRILAHSSNPGSSIEK